ncbi:MAG: 30S ribosomal protein S8e [Nitrososphaerales archaeon]
MTKAVENLRKRKITGGRRKVARSRRAYERDRYPIETILGEERSVAKRVRGGNIKIAAKEVQYANVVDESNKVRRVKILGVVKNPANKEYERRQVITKGAILKTELGLVKVTSRPGQHGVVNAVLVKS